jgi:hypothetical protein
MSFLEQNGAGLNVESQRALGELLQNVLQVIQQQGDAGEPPITPPGGHPQDIQEAMPSSNIEGFAYDDKTGRLMVRFLGKHPERNGPVYAYQGVPPNIADIFMRGAIPAKTNGKNKWGRWWQGKYPSMGAAMAHVIKAGGYPYQRMA